MAPVCAHLRLCGIRIYPYLDDWLLVADTEAALASAIELTCALLHDLGLCINRRKSSFVPTQVIDFIGARLDSRSARAFLPRDRRYAIVHRIARIRQARTVSARSIQSLLGHMSAAIAVVPHAKLRLRPLQLLFNKLFRPQIDPPTKRIRLPDSVLHSLLWWTDSANLTVGVPFQPRYPTVTLGTDASLLGWGATCSNLSTQGRWSHRDGRNHINFLELLAVFKALQAFEDLLLHQIVQVTSDNVATVFYLNKQGGTRSRKLARLAMQIWDWCIPRGITILAVHLAGTDNTEADLLSRHMSRSHEWELDRRVRNRLFHRWGRPDIDLFATQGNRGGFSSTPSSPVSNHPEGRHSSSPRLAIPETDRMADTVTRGDASISAPPTIPTTHAQQSLHPDLQYILESALRPSTRKSYAAKWKRFSNFANVHSFPASSASVSQILQFLFELHQSGLKPSSIKVYIAALSHYRGAIHGFSLFTQPLIKRFLRGLNNLNPTVRSLMPTWSLSVVLHALTRSPFEPMATIDLRLVSWKTAFLVAVTSARRSSELCALRVDPPFLNFHKEKVVLRMDPSFLPKVATSFHMQQEIVLPAFFPVPLNPIERSLHMLDVRRCLAFYRSRTESFRHSNRLFVKYSERDRGSPVTSQRLSKWIVNTIVLAYQLAKLDLPSTPTGHSTRAVAASSAFASGVPIEDVCKAAIWSTPCAFAKHYRLDVRARQDCSFGRAVLSSVLR
ncbi:Protein P [Varanus komodoensis]|nr:Protein P [Varanus komodoensis]